MARVKLTAGRLFAIPFGDGQHALGQIVQKSPLLYVAVWRKSFQQLPVAADLDKAGEILLAGYVSDAGFANRSWPIVGAAPVTESIPRPCYVVDSPNGQVLKHFDGAVLRAADLSDLNFYGRKTIANAAVFEGALNHFLLRAANKTLSSQGKTRAFVRA